MRYAVPVRSLAFLSLTSLMLPLTLTACDGSFSDTPSHREPPPGSEQGDPTLSQIPSCPYDPDCFAGGDCEVECPDYWVCDTHPSGEGKRCTQPGPDYPDTAQDWDCEDVSGRTVCRGASYPDDGAASGWNCEQGQEFVECTKNNPDYPDEPAANGWNCVFSQEFRVCDSGGGSTPGGDGGMWACYDAPTGRECRLNTPSFPDDRNWRCFDAEGQTVCTAPGEVPDNGGDSGWNCVQGQEFVICRDESPQFPDEPADNGWNCEYSREFRVCRSDRPDMPFPGGDNDVCVAGQQRWCDDAVYCSWGKQTCLPDGGWGPCIEPEVTRNGLSDRPDTACGCRYFYFNEDCCEDQEDRNGDGHPDCIIPDNHQTPTCESDGSLCSYCDTNADCGDNDDFCLFGEGGATFCARSCSSDSDCGSGYSCRTINTREGRVQQCTPSGNMCQ